MSSIEQGRLLAKGSIIFMVMSLMCAWASDEGFHCGYPIVGTAFGVWGVLFVITSVLLIIKITQME